MKKLQLCIHSHEYSVTVSLNESVYYHIYKYINLNRHFVHPLTDSDDIFKEFSHITPMRECIRKYREFDKILKTYLDET